MARKGISRGRSIVTLEYGDGILLVAENPSTLLHKVSRIYDRIGVRGRRQVQRVREPPDRRDPSRRRQGLIRTAAAT